MPRVFVLYLLVFAAGTAVSLLLFLKNQDVAVISRAQYRQRKDGKLVALTIHWQLILLEFCSANLILLLASLSGKVRINEQLPGRVVGACGTHSSGGSLRSGVSFLYVFVVFQIWLPRVVLPYDNCGFLHLLKVYMVGMVVARFNVFSNSILLREIVFRAYWMLAFVLLLFLTIPYLEGRCDLFPPNYWVDRLRFYGAETLIMVWFCSGAMNAGDPWGLAPPLTKWALASYVSHEALNRIVPAPYPALFLLAMMPGVFMLYQLRQRICGGPRESSPGGTDRIDHISGGALIITVATVSDCFRGGDTGGRTTSRGVHVALSSNHLLIHVELAQLPSGKGGSNPACSERPLQANVDA